MPGTRPGMTTLRIGRKRRSMPRRLEGDFDYIVVGAGTAGCIVANRLSADPNNRVLILEAGGNDNWIWFHIPVGYLFAIGNPRSDWMFRTEPEAGLNGRALAYPRGKVIGGSSAINAMISMRGQAADYDHWRQLGLTGWGYDDVLPAFRRLEDHFLGEASITAPAAAGGSRRRGCPGPFWMRSATPRRKWASEKFRISTPATMRASAISTSTRSADAAGLRRGVSQARVDASQSASRKERAGRSADRRAGPRRRRALYPGRRSGRGPRQGRSDPVRRLDRIDPGAAPLRHRTCRLAGAARDRGRARPAGRRAQSAGPSAAARDLQGGGRAHPQRDLLLAAAARPDGARLRVPPPRAR